MNRFKFVTATTPVVLEGLLQQKEKELDGYELHSISTLSQGTNNPAWIVAVFERSVHIAYANPSFPQGGYSSSAYLMTDTSETPVRRVSWGTPEE